LHATTQILAHLYEFAVLFFKLEEEEKPRLLLHLPKVFVKTADFASASGSGCRLVEATLQGLIY
jgi:hypothetical protein